MTVQAPPTHRLFTVHVPGIVQYYIALPAHQVLAVIERPQIYQVPLMPAAVRGVLRYQHELLTVLDLAALLTRTPGPEHITHALLATAHLNGKPELIAWPVTADAHLVEAAAMLPTVTSPLSAHPLVAAVVDAGHDKPFALLNLNNLGAALLGTPSA